MLTACEGNDKFGKPFLVYEKPHGHNGETGVLHRLLEFSQFFALKQQFAVTTRSMVVVRTVEILGYVY